jgi:hypothetical protein
MNEIKKELFNKIDDVHGFAGRLFMLERELSSGLTFGIRIELDRQLKYILYNEVRNVLKS